MQKLTRFAENKRGKAAIACLFALIIAMGIELSCINYLPPRITYSANPDAGERVWQELSIGKQGETIGYQVLDNHFVVEKGDPQIIFTSINARLSIIRVVFAEPLAKETPMQLFYAREEEAFSESNSVKQLIGAGAGEAIWSIAESSYQSVRLDIDGDFALEAIQYANSDSIQMSKERGHINLFRVGVLFIIIAALLFVSYRHTVQRLVLKIQEVYRYIHANRSKLLKIVVVLGLMFVASAIIEAIWSALSTNKSVAFNSYRWGFIVAIFWSAYAIWGNRLTIGEKTERPFAIVAMIMGTMIILTSPISTFISWDDETHYRRSVNLSYMDYVPNVPANEIVLAYTPMSERSFKISQVEDANQELEQSYYTNTLQRIKGMSPYVRMGYLPAALGLLIARCLGMPFIFQFMLGKLAGLIVYVAVMYKAIKVLRSRKLLLATIGLIPQLVFLASTYSCDYWVAAFMFYGFARFYRFMQSPKERIKLADASKMVGAVFLACAPKAVYFPLFFPMLFITRSRFRKKDDYKKYLFILITAIAFVALHIYLNNVSGSSMTDTRGGSEVNGKEQIRFIFNDPFQYAYILVRFLTDYINIQNLRLLLSTLGYLGNGSAFLYTVIIFIVAYVAIVDVSDQDRELNWKYKFLTVVMSMFAIVLVATSLYIVFTPVGLDTVLGCQARYLAPVLFPILGFSFAKNIKNTINKNYLAISVFSLMSIAFFLTCYISYVGKYY